MYVTVECVDLFAILWHIVVYCGVSDWWSKSASSVGSRQLQSS